LNFRTIREKPADFFRTGMRTAVRWQHEAGKRKACTLTYEEGREIGATEKKEGGSYRRSSSRRPRERKDHACVTGEKKRAQR